MSRKIIILFLMCTLLLCVAACSTDEPDDITEPAENPVMESTPSPAPDISLISETPRTPIDPTGGLERDEDGMLIGSVVFDEPILLIGMPRINPESYIRVRNGPSTEAEVLTQIVRGQIVEATEVVEGWYHVTVFPDMIEGYIHSAYLLLFEEPEANPNAPEDEAGHNEFYGSDPSGLPRGMDNILVGSVEFDRPVMLMGMSSNKNAAINVRLGPSTGYSTVPSEWGGVTIGRGQLVEAYGVENGWYRVKVFPGMFEGYIRSDLLVPYDSSKQFFADAISGFDTKMNPNEAIIATGQLVDVRTIVPDIVYYIIFATPENFTGKPQYSRNVPILQLGTAEKLRQAQEIFKQDGYSIKLYDAYRPSSVSGRLSEIITDRTYIARAGTSTHNRAAAVDMTLVDSTGRELEMPSPMHTFNPTSHRNSSTMSEQAKANMDYMTSVMTQVGMSNIVSSEWWHFGDSDSGNYLPMDIEFREFTYSEG